VAETLVQLYERLGHLLHSSSAVVGPADADFALDVPRLGASLDAWSGSDDEQARVRGDVNVWVSADGERFRDSVDFLRCVRQCVPCCKDRERGSRATEVVHPETGTARLDTAALVPRMLRGCCHGDLHGRNVFVAVVHKRALWPALFDYEHMSDWGLIAWDFVKLETELKIRVYPQLYSGRPTREYVPLVRDFEERLARRTEACYNGTQRWPEVSDEASQEERLASLLLTLRRQAAMHLGGDRKRPREWLAEYYFALACYGVQSGRFQNLNRLELIGAYVSAGVASASYLWSHESRLIHNAAGGAGASGVEAVASHPYPSFHTPYQVARSWLREEGRRADALALLVLLRRRYPHVLTIGNELVLALLESGRQGEAMAELRRLESQFDEVDEETRCRWGRVHKEAGDRAWEDRNPARGERCYREALTQYTRGHALRQGHYPGINRATVLLLLAALARDQQDEARSSALLLEADNAARQLLDRRDEWPRESSDDNIWHAATAGEAYLLTRRWPDAEGEYRAALAEPNVEPFHRQSMMRQARRIRDAWRRLGVQPEPPFDNLEELFVHPST
jgi:hypothetical protein